MSTESEDSGKNQVHFGEINLLPSGYSSYKEEAGPIFANESPETTDMGYIHFKNFIECIKSRKWQNLNGDILEGHLSTTLCHLGNIASKLKRTLQFNPHSEKFIEDDEANSYLTKMYRAPYILPEKV